MCIRDSVNRVCFSQYTVTGASILLCRSFVISVNLKMNTSNTTTAHCYSCNVYHSHYNNTLYDNKCPTCYRNEQCFFRKSFRVGEIKVSSLENVCLPNEADKCVNNQFLKQLSSSTSYSMATNRPSICLSCPRNFRPHSDGLLSENTCYNNYSVNPVYVKCRAKWPCTGGNSCLRCRSSAVAVNNLSACVCDLSITTFPHRQAEFDDTSCSGSQELSLIHI